MLAVRYLARHQRLCSLSLLQSTSTKRRFNREDVLEKQLVRSDTSVNPMSSNEGGARASEGEKRLEKCSSCGW